MALNANLLAANVWMSEHDLLIDHPLSDAAVAMGAELHGPAPPTLDGARSKLRRLDKRIAHSFEHGGEWKCLTKDELGRFFRDRSAHMVGQLRMQEWWESQGGADPHQETRGRGAALAFWYQLDGADLLPDAIEEGLASTKNAMFSVVFCLTFLEQVFANMPEHVVVLDASQVI
jgi:hypothetical protein